MNESLYLVLVISFLLAGGFLLSAGSSMNSPVQFRWRPRRQLGLVVLALKDNSQDEVFERAGIHLSIARYTSLRNLILLVTALWITLRMLYLGVASSLLQTVLLLSLYLITNPTEYRKGNRPTIFKKILNGLQKSRYEAMDMELMRLVTQLKNLIVTQMDHPWSAAYIIETLMRFTKLTRPIFSQTLSLMRLSKMEAAARYFSSHFHTKLGSDFATILIKLDQLDPSEFLIQIDAFQTDMKEEKRTRQKKKQESSGRKIFLLASCLLSVILFDYMYIMFQFLMEQMAF